MENNICLRKLSLEDTENIVRWRNNPRVLCSFLDQTHITNESHQRYYQTVISSGTTQQFIIVKDERDIGTIFLKDVDQKNRKAEYGILIGEDDCRGKGYGSDAGRLLLDYAFSRLKLNKVYLRVLKENQAGRISYLKIGFAIDGLLREDYCVNGQFEDIYIMSILKKDWMSKMKGNVEISTNGKIIQGGV